MGDQFESFCDNLGLSASQTKVLKDGFDHLETSSSSSHSYQKKLGAACQTAETALGPGRVDTAPLNQTVVHENWSQACVAEPYCIIQPASASDVSKAIRIIQYYGIRFAVRSGGHSPNPGWSNVGKGGILLDMQHMNQVSLASDKKVASVGPGGRWGDVVTTLDAQGATVLGGRISPVGVAGLILGGGLHHLTGEYGTAADNVKNFEVVLADGTITNANANGNSDLFWALKGGGPNFGIVTRFDLCTVPVKEIWYEMRVYSVDDLSSLIDAFVQWLREGSADVKSTASLIMSVDALTVLLQYSAPVENPAAFSPFYGLEPLQIAVPGTIGTLPSLATVLNSVTSAEPMRHDYRAASSGIDAQLYKDVYNFWRPKALAVREATGANQTFTLQPITHNVAEQGLRNGGNPMGIPKENHIWWTSLIDWRDAKDDDAVRSVGIETTEQWKKLGQARGVHIPFLFMNDASRDQNPLASYGTENLEKLKQISHKYDGTQLFQKQQNGGFLLSKV